MYIEEIRNKIKTKKNGFARASYLPMITEWEEKNQQSSWLTACHKNGCGRKVITRKINNSYEQICTECGHKEKLSNSHGRIFLGF